MCEWNHQSKDQPVLDPLDVRGGGQLVEHSDQQGGDRQHHREVHCDGSVEELRQLEEGGDVAEDDQKERREEGVYCFNGQRSLEGDLHQNPLQRRMVLQSNRSRQSFFQLQNSSLPCVESDSLSRVCSEVVAT